MSHSLCAILTAEKKRQSENNSTWIEIALREGAAKDNSMKLAEF